MLDEEDEDEEMEREARPWYTLNKDKQVGTQRFISYRKCKLQITQPSQYKCPQLQHRFVVIEAP